ncbi:MAG: hypothetical protein QOG10_2677, partial [Kribbellaceae bacterium]|nr:hypothetical protein [Kribbellaceae bacterium]
MWLPKDGCSRSLCNVGQPTVACAPAVTVTEAANSTSS